MHNILNRNYAVRDLNFASLRPDPNRYKYAYREIRFRTNCEFSSATPIQTNRPEIYGQDAGMVFLPLEPAACAYVRAADRLRRSQGTFGYIGGAIFGIISYLAIKDLEWFTWGNWFVATMYAFCFCHGGGLIQFRDRERLKSMGEE